MADPARARKIADRIRDLLAENLAAVVKDPDLGMVTITDTRVTPDLQQATVFWTVLGDEDQREKSAELLQRHRGKLRTLIGKGLGIRLTPSLEFVHDALPEDAAHLEDVLRRAKEEDERRAAENAGAQYAAGEDPYKKPADEEQ
ncbi:30S ribosome-binding factor RbfA [Kytococcus sedentarius]|uniref:Ribosome-binding factor A n=1 Tax=Kytococcus sedentarius (strain ATCC 14392 / DSM 20547 / JCM 11482 / CCUG 33030 / NBRC 15357 / NCTC 11040 / CCM 314 / 541) TaxID=478801 RepID=C7NH19_KYTSD|nr:30S ribosome-binding factor RbfA [Kytococcus sedentarius]ACV06189.1 ribosome-binding factor A [Kytococcus sedentarius DSM 20547]QQB64539.1 30S ribosome-binding factor RbfA [Kytococcus sedentarius]STX12390.1 Ribosome-binding factor A [Kytococcus sedentarius]